MSTPHPDGQRLAAAHTDVSMSPPNTAQNMDFAQLSGGTMRCRCSSGTAAAPGAQPLGAAFVQTPPGGGCGVGPPPSRPGGAQPSGAAPGGAGGTPPGSGGVDALADALAFGSWGVRPPTEGALQLCTPCNFALPCSRSGCLTDELALVAPCPLAAALQLMHPCSLAAALRLAAVPPRATHQATPSPITPEPTL